MKISSTMRYFLIVPIVLVLAISPAAAVSPPGGAGETVIADQLPWPGGDLENGRNTDDAGVSPQLTPPYPEYPVSDYVYSKTPTFVFTRHPDASKYSIKVFNLFTGQLIYTWKATGEEYGDSVWIKPPYPLKIYNITAKVGAYLWQVSAKVDGEWGEPSVQAEFRVATAGFTSSFDKDFSKWLPIKGVWSVVSPGYLKNPGTHHYFDSIVHKHLITNNFDLSVSMKIKDLNTGHYAGVIVAGDPATIGPQGEWTWGYHILYRDDGYAAVLVRNGTGNWETVFPWTLNPSIDPGGFNKIGVILSDNRTKLSVFFNDSLWTTITIPGGMSDGYVGIVNYRAGVEKEAVRVDWVKLTVYYDV